MLGNKQFRDGILREHCKHARRRILANFERFSGISKKNLQTESMICGRNVPEDELSFVQVSKVRILDNHRHIHNRFFFVKEML